MRPHPGGADGTTPPEGSRATRDSGCRVGCVAAARSVGGRQRRAGARADVELLHVLLRPLAVCRSRDVRTLACISSSLRPIMATTRSCRQPNPIAFSKHAVQHRATSQVLGWRLKSAREAVREGVAGTRSLSKPPRMLRCGPRVRAERGETGEAELLQRGVHPRALLQHRPDVRPMEPPAQAPRGLGARPSNWPRPA